MFTEQQFIIPKLRGISERTIEEHKKLYAGYVKNANHILERIQELMKESEKYAYELGELHRRFSFEFGGIKNHECYFKLLGTAGELPAEASLRLAIEKQWQTFDLWKNAFTALALTRGIGWAMLSWDMTSKQLLMHWVDEQHLGQLQGTIPILALDMWEHSYVADYFPSGKKQYITDFMEQINWQEAQTNFEAAINNA